MKEDRRILCSIFAIGAQGTEGGNIMNKLRGLREKAGLSQNKLAKQIGAQQCHVSLWESGARPIPYDKAYKAAKVLGCLATELRPGIPGIDFLLQGAPQALIDDVRDYTLFQLRQHAKVAKAV
jgi:transcriptional regulator with XRE-family HTH domain